MNPNDWESLFTVALSHGTFLVSRRLPKFWFVQFVRFSLGLDVLTAHKTGVTPLFLELLWKRRDQDVCNDDSPDEVGCDAQDCGDGLKSSGDGLKSSEDLETCSFEAFVKMMERLALRCYQALRASELLHRFNEKVAITSTAPQSLPLSQALSHVTRYYFAKTCERAFVSRDTEVTMDQSRSTVSHVGRLVLEHLFGSLMDSVVLPLFQRFSVHGRMTIEYYAKCVAHVFQGCKAPNEGHVRAAFCQVNRNDLFVSLVPQDPSAQSPPLTGKGYKRGPVNKVPVPQLPPELELDEFIDALCLLGIIMYANELKHPHLRTVEGKVWAFMEHVCTVEGQPMCRCALSDADLMQVEPRVSLVFPAALPVHNVTGFVVSGVCLDNHAGTPTLLNSSGASGPAAATTSTAAAGGERAVARTMTQQRMMCSPSTRDISMLAAAAMLQSRTTQNAIAQLSSSLFTNRFDHSTARVAACRAPHKPLSERVGLRPQGIEIDELCYPSSPTDQAEVSNNKSPGSSFLSFGSRPSTAARVPQGPALGASGSDSPNLMQQSISSMPGGGDSSPLMKSQTSVRDDTSAQPTQPTTQRVAPVIYFSVGGHRIQQVEKLASQRLKLQLPPECLLPASAYFAFCTFRVAAPPSTTVSPSQPAANASHLILEDSEFAVSSNVFCALHRERVTTVCVQDEHTHRIYNSRPIVLKLKVVKQKFAHALQAALDDVFDTSAPSGRMDLLQFRAALERLKNCAKVSAPSLERAFGKFSSDTNAEMKVQLSERGDDVEVIWSSEGVSTLPGPPRLTFLGFLHAVAFLYLEQDNEGAKTRVTSPSAQTYQTPNMEKLFELAFEDNDLFIQKRNEKSAKGVAGLPISPRRHRKCLDELVEKKDQQVTCPAWDQRMQAPFDRALKWRAYNKRENEALAGTLQEEFKRILESEPPAPNFIPNNPMETLLSAAVALDQGSNKSLLLHGENATDNVPPPESHHDQNVSVVSAAGDAQQYQAVPPAAPSTARALASVLSRTSLKDSQLSFEARSQSMKLEYFECAMVRTLSNRSRF